MPGSVTKLEITLIRILTTTLIKIPLLTIIIVLIYELFHEIISDIHIFIINSFRSYDLIVCLCLCMKCFVCWFVCSLFVCMQMNVYESMTVHVGLFFCM